MIIWLQFIACACVILFAGKRLSIYGDLIAEKTGLGRVWIGVILMASVTSLPELITGVSSVAIFDVPDIAAGDVLGSCMFNILIIAVLDSLSGSTPVLTRTNQGQVLTAAFGIAMLSTVGISMIFSDRAPAVGWVGIYSIGLLGLYLGAIRSIFLYEKNRNADLVDTQPEHIEYIELSRARLYTLYGINAFFVIGASVYLPHIGEEIAKITGLGQTFVGSLFIAFSTSLPEVVVSIVALRIGAPDMAVGNLVGSNLFNLGILAVDDIFYTSGPLLSLISRQHLITATAAAMMTAIAITGLIYRAERKRLILSASSLGIVSVYLIATYILSVMRTP